MLLFLLNLKGCFSKLFFFVQANVFALSSLFFSNSQTVGNKANFTKKQRRCCRPQRNKEAKTYFLPLPDKNVRFEIK